MRISDIVSSNVQREHPARLTTVATTTCRRVVYMYHDIAFMPRSHRHRHKTVYHTCISMVYAQRVIRTVHAISGLTVYVFIKDSDKA